MEAAEAAKGKPIVSPSMDVSPTRQLTDPIVVSIAAGVLGYVVGSGQWNLVRRGAGKIAQSLGNLTMLYLYDSFRRHNPQLFNEKTRMTH